MQENSFIRDKYTVKWKFNNELGLVFVAVYLRFRLRLFLVLSSFVRISFCVLLVKPQQRELLFCMLASGLVKLLYIDELMDAISRAFGELFKDDIRSLMACIKANLSFFY